MMTKKEALEYYAKQYSAIAEVLKEQGPVDDRLACAGPFFDTLGWLSDRVKECETALINGDTHENRCITHELAMIEGSGDSEWLMDNLSETDWMDVEDMLP